MTHIGELLAERQRSWLDHPIITESAVLPTRSVRDAVARVTRISRKARASIAFWADPVVGKSFCIQAIRKTVEKEFPGAGILSLEAVEDKQQAEGRLLVSILKSIGFVHKVDRDLAEKRDQVKRALIALSGHAKRIFIFIDEAQEVSNQEFAWLKKVINDLSGAGIKVTTIMFGQRELLRRKANLKADGRSDLSERFMKVMLEFKGLRKARDLTVVCEAMDQHSEYPEGSGWTYTRYLFPRAYDGGFRFAKMVPVLWDRLVALVPPIMLKQGLPMEVIAALMANLCIACKEQDGPDLAFDVKVVDRALVQALGG